MKAVWYTKTGKAEDVLQIGEQDNPVPITGEVLSTNSLGVKGIILPPVILSNAIFMMDENSNVFYFE